MNIKSARTLALATSLFLVPTSFQAAFAADLANIATSSLEKVSSVKTSADSSKIDINSASVEELTSVSGIGTSIAKKIVSYREQYGDFTDLTDLVNINGIGSTTLTKIIPYLSL